MKRQNPILNQLNIVSSNLAASMAFYRRLGVEIPSQSVWQTTTGTHHASAAMDDLDLEFDSTAFARIWNAGWRKRDNIGGRVVLGFSVASREAVDEIYAGLTGAGYTGLQAPSDAFWGARYAIVEDPDGIAVGLMSPVSAEFRSQPPDV